VRAFHRPFATGLLTLVALGLTGPQAGAAATDPERGAQVFRSCAACHSLKPGEHRTGPSLAGVLGRHAGTAEGFTRYSSALEQADVTWTEETLDRWLAEPQAVVPGNSMTFPGIRDQEARADLIAYLKIAVGEREGPPATAGGGMIGGGMVGSDMPDLKAAGPDQKVTAIRYCGDSYYVTTAAGETHPFWEFNLRFKTDSSDKGPGNQEPAFVPASMMGDRAFVIFADPAEISAFIEKHC
jgi:cytochrome c